MAKRFRTQIISSLILSVIVSAAVLCGVFFAPNKNSQVKADSGQQTYTVIYYVFYITSSGGWVDDPEEISQLTLNAGDIIPAFPAFTIDEGFAFQDLLNGNLIGTPITGNSYIYAECKGISYTVTYQGIDFQVFHIQK